MRCKCIHNIENDFTYCAHDDKEVKTVDGVPQVGQLADDKAINNNMYCCLYDVNRTENVLGNFNPIV